MQFHMLRALINHGRPLIFERSHWLVRIVILPQSVLKSSTYVLFIWFNLSFGNSAPVWVHVPRNLLGDQLVIPVFLQEFLGRGSPPLKRVENVWLLLLVNLIFIDRLLLIFYFERFELLGVSYHAILTVNILDSVDSLHVWFHNVPFNDVYLIPLSR